MNPNAEQRKGSFFGQTRKYTRHLRPQDEFSDEEENDDLLFLRAPRDHVPEVSRSERNKLRNMAPTSDELYEDPIMDYEEMHVTDKEVIQFSQDILSKKMADALSKKCHYTDPLDELFVAMDETDETHEAATASTGSSSSSSHLAKSFQKQEEREERKGAARESKNKRRKKKRVELWGLQFQGVPKVPKRHDHFFYIRKDSVALFQQQMEVRTCCDVLTPYLFWRGERWIQHKYSLEDMKHIGRSTGFYFYKTYERVQTLYTVHTFTDVQQEENSQIQNHHIMVFLVCAKHSNGCYFMVTFFFMKNV